MLQGKGFRAASVATGWSVSAVVVRARSRSIRPSSGTSTDDRSAEYGVRYTDPAGIAWYLPGLAAAGVARLCIATVWCPRDDDRFAAWFAVDMPLDTAYLHLIAEPA